MMTRTADRLTFERILAPLTLEEFLARAWERSVLHLARHGTEDFRDVIAPEDVDAILSFHLIPGNVPFSTANRSGIQVLPGQLTPNDAFDAYHRGDSLFLPDLHRRWQPIAVLARQMEVALRHPVGATLVVTPPAAQGLEVHYDITDVFVLQIDGRKEWRVYEPISPLPLAVREVREADLEGRPSQRYQLEPGDVLYIPRGFPHLAVTSDEPSTHLSLYVSVLHWRDLLIGAIESLAEEAVELRQALPPGLVGSAQVPADLEAAFAERLRLVLDRVTLDQALDRITAGFLDQLRPLPNGRLTQLQGAAGLTESTQLERLPGTICRVARVGEGVVIQFPGGSVQGPAFLEEAFRFVATANRFTPAELPGRLSDSSKLVLARRLLREGLVRLADD